MAEPRVDDWHQKSSFFVEIRYVWKSAYRLIVAGAILGVLVSAILSWVLPRSYTATAVIGPRVADGSKAPEGIQALASTFGFKGGGTAQGQFSQFLEMTESVSVARDIMRNESLLPKIFGAQWNAQEKAWRHPSGPGFIVKSVIRKMFAGPDWHPPSEFDLAGTIRGRLTITAEKGTQLQRLTYKASSPEQAQMMLALVISHSDGLLRERERARVSSQVNFLEKRLQDVSVASYRASLINLIQEQEQQLMLINTNLPFALDILDPASCSGNADGVGTGARILLGVVFGSLFSGALAYWLLLYNKSERIWSLFQPMFKLGPKRRKHSEMAQGAYESARAQ